MIQRKTLERARTCIKKRNDIKRNVLLFLAKQSQEAHETAARILSREINIRPKVANEIVKLYEGTVISNLLENELRKELRKI